MDIDRGLISAVLREGYPALSKLGMTLDMMEGEGRPAFEFLETYWREHAKLPDAETIRDQIGVNVAGTPKEPVAFWCAEIKKRFLYNALQIRIAKILDPMEKALSYEALTEYRKGFFELETLFKESAGVEPIFSDIATIMDEHDRAKLGIIGIPSPYPTLNEATQGWQPEEMIIIAGRPGLGKSLCPKTRIIRANGSICEAQVVKPGDHLMGPDGNPRLVRGVHRGREEMFEVIPIKGEPWRCNRSHILSLKCSTNVNASFRKGEIYNLTIDELKALPSRVQAKLKLWRTGFEMEEVSVPVDPYIFGLWLGDGDFRCPTLTNPEPEIEAEIISACSINGWLINKRVDPRNGCPRFGISKAKPLLRLIKESTESGQKRIPSNYLRNSRAVRLQLLAGLLDTDGHLVEENGAFEIITKYDGLRDDILFLARSLGLAANSKNKKGTIKSLGFVGNYFRINICGHLDMIPTKVKRKQAIPRRQIKDVLVTGFELKSVGEGEFYGFDIGGDHLYLLWDTTVTHNTNLMIIMSVHAWLHGHKILFISTEMSRQAIKRRFAAFVCKIPYGKLRRGKLTGFEEDNLRAKLKEIENDPRLLMLGSDMRPVMETVEAQCLVHKPDMLCVDGFYLMKSDQVNNAKNKSDRVSENLDLMKAMLKRLKIPGMLTTQMNRPPQNQRSTNTSKPDLDRLAFSDNMGMIADYVFFLDRNEKMRQEKLIKLTPVKMREADFVEDLFLNWDFEAHNFTESDKKVVEEEEKKKKASKAKAYKDDDDTPAVPW